MDNIIHIQTLRKQKELQLTSFIEQRVESIHFYVDRYVNIREKVKAKHIFSEKVSCPDTAVLSKIEEQLFLDWFTYDYLTIQGKTIYQIFDENAREGKSHPFDAIVHALFMASVLEPFKVIKSNESHIYAEKILTGDNCIIKTATNRMSMDHCVIFLRSIPVLDHFLCISEIFVQPDEEIIYKLLIDSEKSKESWRTFLKKFAIKYCWTRF